MNGSYTAPFIASMETIRDYTAVCALFAMMRGDGNTPKMRSVISSAIILYSELNVTAGQYYFLFMEIPRGFKISRCSAYG